MPIRHNFSSPTKKSLLNGIKSEKLAGKKASLKNELEDEYIFLNIPNGLLKDTIKGLKRGILLNQIITGKNH